MPEVPSRILGHLEDCLRLPEDALSGHSDGAVAVREQREGQERPSAIPRTWMPVQGGLGLPDEDTRGDRHQTRGHALKAIIEAHI